MPQKKPITKKKTQRHLAKQATATAPEQYTPITLRSKLPAAWIIAQRSGEVLWQHISLFVGITAVYALLTILLVRGSSGWTSKTSGDKVNFINQLITSSNTSASQAAGAYQALFIVVVSLAVIWSLRRVLAGDAVRVRDAFYQGMYPLVPVIFIVLVVGVQLLPFVIGAGLYALVVGNGIAIHLAEQIFWAVVFVLSAFVSLYMICSSVFALYIATLPNMTPLKALRSARQLVKGRRPAVLRKLLFLPLALLVIGSLIMLPFVFWLTVLAPLAYFLLSMCGLVVINTYLYMLYRELLV